jgi:hypothetical protein
MEQIDNIHIENIKFTKYFSSVVSYPKTLSDLQLFLENVDKLKIVKGYNINKVLTMDSNSLDVLFIIIIISNKIINKLVANIVFNTYGSILKNIFKPEDDLKNQKIIDKINNDIYDYYINYFDANIDTIHVKDVDTLETYLENKILKDECGKILEELDCDIVSLINKLKDQIKIASVDVSKYSSIIINESSAPMKMFLSIIFNDNCNESLSLEVLNRLKQHFDDNYLNITDCTDIDSYICSFYQ